MMKKSCASYTLYEYISFFGYLLFYMNYTSIIGYCTAVEPRENAKENAI